MKKVQIDDARLLINRLIKKGYDKSIPDRRSDQDIRVSYEASAQLVVMTQKCKSSFHDASDRIENISSDLLSLLKSFRRCLEPFITTVPSKARLEGTLNEFDRLYHNLNLVRIDGESQFDDECGCIDSDEEAQLYEELDNLMEAQERALAFKGDSKKFMANAFQKLFMRIQELEAAFEYVSEVETFPKKPTISCFCCKT